MPIHPKLTPLTHVLRLHYAFKTGVPALGLSLALPLAAQAQGQEWTLNIPAQPLASALQALGQQTGAQLLYSPRDLDSVHSSTVTGRHGLEEAVRIMLQGSGLRYQIEGSTVTVVASSGSGMQLGATNIESTALGAMTDGTGSYTTGSTSTATKLNLSLRETPQSISVITRQRMDDQQLNSISEVLQQTPGITMTQNGGERFNIYSRGGEISNYQFDGVTTYMVNQTRAMPQTLLDMTAYDHVEVLRGATGLMVGAGDPSGVINLVHKRPTADFQAHVQAGTGSWDYNRAEADVSGPLVESGKVRGRLVAAKQDNHTFMDWYTQSKDVLYGVVEADVTDSTLVRFAIDYQKYKANGSPGVPLLFSNGKQTDFSRSTSSSSRNTYEQYSTYNYTLTLEQKLLDDWTLKVVANELNLDRTGSGATYYSPTGTSNLNEATGAALAQRTSFTTEQTQQGLDINLEGSFEAFGHEHQLTAGFNYGNYKNTHNTFNAGPNAAYGDIAFNYYTWDNYLPEANDYYHDQIFKIRSQQRGYFLATRLNPTDDLHFILGTRISDYDFDYSLNYTNKRAALNYKMAKSGQVTPYAGVVYDLNDQQSVYASYTDIFKPQNAQDRNGSVIEPVVGSNYEVGWKGEFFDNRLNTAVSTYYIKRDNLAVLDTGYRVPGTTTSAYKAEDGAVTRGYDLEVAGELARGWNLSASFNHSITKTADGARTQLEYSADTFKLWSTYNFDGDWRKLTVGGGMNWNSPTSVYYSRYDVYARQDDYAVFNAMARYHFTDHLSASLNGNNLFDKKYYSGLAGNNYGHYGAPRNFIVDMRYDF